MTITLRSTKGSPLTHPELDGNFTDLDGRATAAQDAADAAQVDADAATAAAAGKYTKPGSGIPASDLTTAVQSSLAKADSALQTAPVTSVAGRTGVVTLAKADVGLSNVDNTSDANKPVSTATQAALDGKAALATASLAVTASRALTNADAGKTLDVTASGVTLTVPAGLTLVPGVIILANTTTSIAFTGTTGNGAGTTIVLSDNKVGTIIPTSVANAYRVTGGV